jgi:separase
VQMRTVLEQFAAKLKERQVKAEEDSHLFLVLDRNVQGIPWENIPILRGRSVSRIPSIDFLMDQLQFASLKQGVGLHQTDKAVVDARNTFYILNPSGDLKGTEGRLKGWLTGMHSVGWEGIVGRPPSEQQFLNALSRKDLVMYVVRY